MKINTLSKPPQLLAEHHHFLVAVKSEHFKDAALKAISKISPSEHLLSQARRQLDAIQPEDKKPCVILNTDWGNKVYVLGLPSKFKTFDLHSWLRNIFHSDVSKMKSEKAVWDLHKISKADQKRILDSLIALVELSGWKPPKITNRPDKKSVREPKIDLYSTMTKQEVDRATLEATAFAKANNLVRTLADTPANFLNPEQFISLIRERAKKRSYKCSVLTSKQLKQMKAGAFLAVASGGLENTGGIVHLYNSPKRKSKKLVLVGKGLCYDTGGINVKPAKHMYGMQKDMTGAAVALATFELIKELKLPIEVHALLGITENRVSHTAYKPSDVVTSLDGTTIEIIHSDAEGRMVLADLLTMAKREKSDLVLDFATLTGSCVAALDTKRSGVFSYHDNLLRKAYEVGESCGERVWPFPIGEDYKDPLKSEIADTLQCLTVNEADHIYAATFLGHFIGDEIPWIHMDLSSSENKGGLGLVSTLSTGFGVRWALELTKEVLCD